MDKINGEIKRVIGSGGADHCDRIDFKLYDRTGAAGHSDGFYYWSNPSDSRNDVLYTGCRDVDDTDGREDRNPDRTVKKAAGDHRVVFCTWIYHHNIGTGSAGAGRAGIEVLPEIFFIRWYKALISWFSADQWAYISVVLFVLFLGMVALFFYSSSVWMKKTGFTLGVVLLFFTVMTIVFSVKQNNRIVERDNAIVVTPSVTVKGAPDASGTSLFVIHEGLKVKVIESLGDWVNIRLEDGNEGWVAKNDVEKI